MVIRMKDVDIVGATSEGKLIYAQVTFSRLESAGWKLAKLDAYSAENQYTILFCRLDYHRDSASFSNRCGIGAVRIPALAKSVTIHSRLNR